MDVAAFDELMEARYQAVGRSWKDVGEVAKRNANQRLEALSTQQEVRNSVLSGLAIKNPPKGTHPKKPT
jgi:hypothetical protein